MSGRVASRGAGRAGAALLLLLAFAIRGIWFGDPVVHVDEQFYLLVGDRLLHQGALPFVDIWDRKPVGLFLLYALARLAGGAGIVQYQVLATLFAWGTALVVAALASAGGASRRASVGAGAVYLLWPAMLGGAGGQSPIFYNLPMALAALLTLRATAAGTEPRRIVLLGAAAMALAGLAMQVKYTALFEGVFFGCALLRALWRRTGRILPVLPAGALWVAVAVAPTAAALAWYWAIGQAPAFVYANFVSIGARGGAPAAALLSRLRFIALVLSPLALGLALARHGTQPPADPDERAGRSFLLWWLAAAAAGLLLFGTYYNHYALPLLPPFCAALAPALDRRGGRFPGPALAALLLVVGIAGNARAHEKVLSRRGDARYAARVARLVRDNLHGRCLFVYDGEPILYYLTASCIPTRYAFPSHLNEMLEAHAIGVDPVAEVRAILARRPAVIVDSVFQPTYRPRTQAPRPGDNRATAALVQAAIARDYRLAGTFPFRRDIRRVWVRLPGR